MEYFRVRLPIHRFSGSIGHSPFHLCCYTRRTISKYAKRGHYSLHLCSSFPAAFPRNSIPCHILFDKDKPKDDRDLYLADRMAKSVGSFAMLPSFGSSRPLRKDERTPFFKPLFTHLEKHVGWKRVAYQSAYHGMTSSQSPETIDTTRRWQSRNAQANVEADVRTVSASAGVAGETARTSYKQQVCPYDISQQIAYAESSLRKVYGPQAKLILQTLPHQQTYGQPGENSASDESKMGTRDCDGSESLERTKPFEGLGLESLQNRGEDYMTQTKNQSNYYYRVSVVFRQLGFPVEVAVVRGRKAQEVIEKCVKQALGSDLEFIQPSPNSHNASYLRNKSSHSKKKKPEHKAHTQSSDHSNSHPVHKHRNRQTHTMSPHQLELKAILDELRQLCLFFSRSLKFSIRPSSVMAVESDSSLLPVPRQAHGEAIETPVTTANQWRCRAYVKNDWSVVARTSLALETSSSSPAQAFSKCVAELRRVYKEEIDSDDVMLASVREVELLAPPGSSVVATCVEEGKNTQSVGDANTLGPIQPGRDADMLGQAKRAGSLIISQPNFAEIEHSFLPTYCATIKIQDKNGNVSIYQSRYQATRIQAYENAALQAIRSRNLCSQEAHLLSEGLTSPPLLLRMRWQFDAMVTAIAALTGKQSHELPEIRITAANKSHLDQGMRDDTPLPSVPAHRSLLESSPLHFKASFVCDGVVMWESTGGGRYRVEFDVYVQALYYLLDRYEDLLMTWTQRQSSHNSQCYLDEVSYNNVAGLLRMSDACLLFSSSAMLQFAVDMHDRFSIIKNHTGKWNCYALLGTLTSRLIGCFYQTSYSFNEQTKEWWATLTIDDGLRTDQVLIQRSSKVKGEAWRLACVNALRENFPRQYQEAVRHYPDVDLSGDTMARASRFRALPREKRIQHIGDLFSLVAAFTEEDLGWSELRIRLRNASGDIGLPQWIAEMEAQVEGEEGRRVVAVSPPYAQVRNARRALLYRVAKAYLPKELAIYRKLERADSQDPDTDLTTCRTKLYQVGNPCFLWQLCTLLGSKHPSLEPITWQLRLRPCARSLGMSFKQFTKGEGQGRDDAHVDHNGSSLCSLGDDELVEWLSLLSEGSPLALSEILSAPDQLHQPLGAHFTYAADVFGANGDVLISEYHGASSESAVSVLIAALKAASKRLGGADAEVLWTEFETHSCPPMSHPKALALYLFHSFFGDSGTIWGLRGDKQSMSAWQSNPTATGLVSLQSAGKNDEVASNSEPLTPKSRGHGSDMNEVGSAITNASVLAIDTAQLGNYWVSTACLRQSGMLPIARAIAMTKRGSVVDVLTLAARVSFGRLLHEMARRQPCVSALAGELLTDPVMERLPEAAVRDLLMQLKFQRHAVQHRLSPFKLLLRCMYRDYRRQKRIRAEQSQEVGGGSFQCRLYLQPDTRQVRKGDVQLVGFGSAISSGEALDQASRMALKNLFPEDAAAAI